MALSGTTSHHDRALSDLWQKAQDDLKAFVEQWRGHLDVDVTSGILTAKATSIRMAAAGTRLDLINDSDLDVTDDYLPAAFGARLRDKCRHWISDVGIDAFQLSAFIENLAATCQ